MIGLNAPGIVVIGTASEPTTRAPISKLTYFMTQYQEAL